MPNESEAAETTVAPKGVSGSAIQRTNESKLVALIARIADERDIYFDSMLDVGCGSRPQDQWFTGYRRAEAPRRFVGVDSDPAVVDALMARRVPAFRNFSAPFDISSDLVVAADVLEYVKPTAAPALLKNCASRTVKMFALSTLNASFWKRSGVNSDFGWLKWVPETILRCYRDAEDPLRIKNTVDAARVQEMMAEAFPSSDWDVTVYEASPWEIKDVASGQAATFHTRTFAVALRKGKQ